MPQCKHGVYSEEQRCDTCSEISDAVAEERERCAKECELVSQNWSANNDEYKAVALMCAQQIRTGRH